MKTIKNGLFVIRKLKKEGYEAYFVGGCVRDFLLGNEVVDIDITTNAKPNKVLSMFSKAKPTGLKYGTVTVLHEVSNIEVTTYRIDGKYKDFRHPEEIIATDLVSQDVLRRDFTINGLLMDENFNVIDYVGGKKDLASKTIKAIGNPNDRFSEDALRMLRAAYFQAKLGFEIEPDTLNAMKENAVKLSYLPNERILTELLKLLANKDQIKALNSLMKTDLVKYLPGLEKGIKFVVENLSERLFIDSFFALCFTLNKKVDAAWKFSNIHKNKYQKVVELALSNRQIDQMVLYEYGLEISLLANKVLFLLKRSANHKSKIQRLYDNMPIKGITDLAVKGNDILKITNKKQGAWLKQLLDELVRKVILSELKNDKQVLLDYAQEKLK